MNQGWISEKQYNKTRGGDCTKVLVGNWKEEQVLEGDMITMGHSLETTRKKENSNRVIGGFNSTPFMISTEEPSKRKAEKLTTHRVSYTNENGDVTKQRKSALGVRSHLRANQVILEAKDEFVQIQCDRADRAVPKKTTTLYRETIGGDFAPKRVVEGVETNYLYDKPITMYVKNPVSGKQMTVHGMTLRANRDAELDRCSTFTDPKYML
eukprot:Tbor_TRINITY_DN4466_c0_g2::TRINITY_DN4466_c0_g2_i1::g.7988::m.7988